MAVGRIEEILARLEHIEAHIDNEDEPRSGSSATSNGGGAPPGPPGLGEGFDEKRVVDLIVRLVAEQVDQVIKRRLDDARPDDERLAQLVGREVDRRLAENNARLADRDEKIRKYEAKKRKKEKKKRKKEKNAKKAESD